MWCPYCRSTVPSSSREKSGLCSRTMDYGRYRVNSLTGAAEERRTRQRRSHVIKLSGIMEQMASPDKISSLAVCPSAAYTIDVDAVGWWKTLAMIRLQRPWPLKGNTHDAGMYLNINMRVLWSNAVPRTRNSGIVRVNCTNNEQHVHCTNYLVSAKRKEKMALYLFGGSIKTR